MKENIQYKFKMLFYKLKYLDSEIKTTKEDLTGTEQEFARELQQYLEDNNIDAGTFFSLNQQANTEHEKETIEGREELPGNIKKLYREIAKDTHPDKNINEKDEKKKNKKEKLYKQATQSYSTRNIVDLLEIAEEAGIDIPEIDEEQVTFLEKSIEKYENELKHLKSTFIFHYHECTDENQKKEILKNYLNAILNMGQ